MVLGVVLVLLPGFSVAEDCLERVGRAPHGVADAVTAQGILAYLGNGAELMIVDLVDPSDPVLMGTHDEAGDVMDFAFSDEHVFTARYVSGVDVFILCQGPLFADGFETGDTTAWSGVTP